MSAENVEVVRRALAAISAGPEEILATAAGFWDSDADYYPARKFPEAQPCHGLQEIAQALTRIRETWAKYEWVVQELIEVGDDRVLAWSNLQAQGRSGMNVEGDVYQCIWLRRGRLLRVEDHLTLSGALHAFGLEGDTLEAAGLRAPSNLELVRAIFAAWERGDFSSTEWAHPEIEYQLVGVPDVSGSWKGVPGMTEAWRGWLTTWEDFRTEVEEYRELDAERVLVFSHWTGRGKTSGLELGQLRTRAATLFHVRDNKVTKIVGYFDRDHAFADLGLAPETDSARS